MLQQSDKKFERSTIIKDSNYEVTNNKGIINRLKLYSNL